MFRSSLLRLVRPASNAVSRRAPTPVPFMPSSMVNGSVRVRASLQMRSISSSPVCHQSAAASAAIEPIKVAEAEGAEASEGTDEQLRVRKSTEAVMAEYAARKATGEPIALAEYEAYFRHLGYNKTFDEAVLLLQDMRTAGVQPSSNIFGNIMKAGRRGLRISEVRELFGMPLDPRIRADKDAAEGAAESRQPSKLYERMKALKQECEAEGLQLETWFWDDCAAWLAGINNAGLLINIAMALEERGVLPSTRFYNKMLYALPRCGFADRADILFARMVLNGLADVGTYSVRLGSLVYMNRSAEADTLFQEAKAKFQLTEVLYNTIIHGYLQARQFPKALDALQQMKADAHVKPTAVTACTFLSYFYDSGDLTKANDLLAEFKDTLGFPTTLTDRANLIKFYGRYEPMQATRLLQEQVATEPNFGIDIYNAVLTTLIDRKVPIDWKRSIGEVPLDKVYTLQAGGMAELCTSLPYHMRHLVARMEAYGVAPNAVTFDLLMRGLLMRKEFSSVCQLYTMLTQNTTPFLAAYSSHHNSYLAALIDGGAPSAQISEFLLTMRLRRWPISALNSRKLAENGIQVPLGAFLHRQYKKDGARGGPPQPGQH